MKTVLKNRIIFCILSICVIFTLVFIACSRRLEDPPIITSSTQQHTLYNGRPQPIEAIAAKEGAPPPIVTYFLSEEDLNADRNSLPGVPSDVGFYYVRVRRPAGNGFRAGPDITVEYHIQKDLITISAEARQEFVYDGNPKEVVFTVDKNIVTVTAYYQPDNTPLNAPPSRRGNYLAIISYAGDDHHMGAEKIIELVIR